MVCNNVGKNELSFMKLIAKQDIVSFIGNCACYNDAFIRRQFICFAFETLLSIIVHELVFMGVFSTIQTFCAL